MYRRTTAACRVDWVRHCCYTTQRFDFLMLAWVKKQKVRSKENNSCMWYGDEQIGEMTPTLLLDGTTCFTAH